MRGEKKATAVPKMSGDQLGSRVTVWEVPSPVRSHKLGLRSTRLSPRQGDAAQKFTSPDQASSHIPLLD